MTVLRLALALSLLAGAASAAPDDDLPPREIVGPVEARVLKVRDGDTVEVEAYVWPLQTVTVAVRLRNVDAPELRGKCEEEKAAARRARERLAELVGEGSVTIRHISGDKYFGRVLAEMGSAAAPDLGAVLLREGLVDAYDGGRRRDWCAPAVGSLRNLFGRG